MNIEFKVEEKNVNGSIEYRVYDVTNGNEYVGCVKKFTWNKGNKSEFQRYEPFDFNGERMSGYGMYETIDELIDYLMRVHTSRKEEKKNISNSWESLKEDAKRIGVSEESFKRYGNARSYLGDILLSEDKIKEIERQLSEIKEFTTTDSFKEAPETVQDLIQEKIKEMEKTLTKIHSEIETMKGYLKGY